MFDFEKLTKDGMTVIYKETNEKVKPDGGWEYRGEKNTPEETTYSWYQIVTFEKAEQHYLEN